MHYSETVYCEECYRSIPKLDPRVGLGTTHYHYRCWQREQEHRDAFPKKVEAQQSFMESERIHSLQRLLGG
jgi:hypothetical protein